ncbi:hypothetical protein [Ruminiclostridium papyrosolvens]|uniref:Uncharacterized protein n=1 Tax=Ruminiclostridium papyrosolvens C7 TaxID=1330534 RepID=U4R1K8_9FIRM|nr:hypothetical protein [Ruminiclostridium papyrosolvens]EPR10560.1 hypothetical protein L323_13500 [Ruminiclostridium papyrosolvens C7]
MVVSICTALTIGTSAATVSNNSTSSISASSTVTAISSSKAVSIIKGLIANGTIVVDAPTYQVQYWDTGSYNNKSYYIIRIAYIDPNYPEMTETLGRYWVSTDTGSIVYEENIYTYELTRIL